MNPAADLHVLLRQWKEGCTILDGLLADVVGGSVPSDPQSDLRHVRLNDLQRRITNVWDRLCTHGIVNGPPPRFGLPSGADWYVPPLWVSPWVSSPGSEWTLLRQLLAQGLDGKVLLSRLRERSQTVGAALERLVPAPAPAPGRKRSTERGEGRAKLIAALTKHHRYADGSCLNQGPIGNNELARAAGVSASTASAFFNDKFQGHTKYKALCRDAGKLAAALKLLNDEFSPHVLLGDASADLAAPEQGDADLES